MATCPTVMHSPDSRVELHSRTITNAKSKNPVKKNSGRKTMGGFKSCVLYSRQLQLLAELREHYKLTKQLKEVEERLRRLERKAEEAEERARRLEREAEEA